MGGADERASLGQDSRLRYKRGMEIELLPASASTLTRGPCVRSHGIWKLNGGCDFSWGSPGSDQPWQSGPCDGNLMGLMDSGHFHMHMENYHSAAFNDCNHDDGKIRRYCL